MFLPSLISIRLPKFLERENGRIFQQWIEKKNGIVVYSASGVYNDELKWRE